MGNGRILIVDDDPDFVAVLKLVLENERYTVAAAPDREQGMDQIQAAKPDLIIMDVMMSTWSDGFEMSRDLKQDPLYQDIPILMLTGVEEKAGISFKSTAGDPQWLPVNGFLDKPVEREVLLDEIRNLLSRKTQNGAGT
jgi:CheY-like chemotaxis protein